MLKMCPPLITVLYTTAHFWQLRQWCITVAYAANAEICKQSPLLDAVEVGEEAIGSSAATTAGGTAAPYLQLGTQMPAPHLADFPIVWEEVSTFDGMAGEAPTDRVTGGLDQ